MRWKLWAAAAGLASAAAVLAIAEVIAVFAGASTSPLFAVGSLVIDLAPPGVKDLVIQLFGTGDKAALLTLLGVIVAVLAALAGLLEWRRTPFGVALLVLVSGVAVLAVTTRSGAGALSGLPTVVGMIAGALLLRMLAQRLRAWQTAATRTPATAAPARVAATPAPTTPAPARVAAPAPTTPAAPSLTPAGPAQPAAGAGRVDRRRFLVATGVTAVAAVFAGVIARSMNAAASAVTAAREAITLPTAATPAPAAPAGAELGIDGLASYITPNADFYRIDTALQVPSVDASTWSLKITGMVEQEIELSWNDLVALPLEEHPVTLACVSNEVGGDLIGNALWLGYPIRELLARAKPLAGADMVLSRSIDGFTAGTPLEVLQDPDRVGILAVGMNGEPLPVEHGFPVRVVVAGLYGYVSATKWVTELELTTFDESEGYWTPRGWSALGPVKTESRIDVPRVGASVAAGSTPIAGVAWAQHTGIQKVEVKVDDGPWADARLADTAGIDTWVQWVYDWDATPGDHTVSVRATDRSGYTQTPDEASPAPDGASGWHTRTLSVS
ncbi:molybdopterin-dependent oxidoreductase [Herbiconiux sp. CPCC 205716]|uniref:Molybdopterin-dependent oxidoreductase n=1 Tax=Herbiconiux gentiana TaxID=2970912 RepID=A0ABT2GH62_9MICO|nr:molybdopterin-dependent oxidoreductase [Herbiconiux gentiana]MCS5714244.1 molybdopterin-dependent oxidoreductase [Herbiconiux gentiana]